MIELAFVTTTQRFTNQRAQQGCAGALRSTRAMLRQQKEGAWSVEGGDIAVREGRGKGREASGWTTALLLHRHIRSGELGGLDCTEAGCRGLVKIEEGSGRKCDVTLSCWHAPLILGCSLPAAAAIRLVCSCEHGGKAHGG